jgi:hypothetical protein
MWGYALRRIIKRYNEFMDKIIINKENNPQRCEICHKNDLFDPKLNYCLRCRTLLENNSCDQLQFQNNNELKNISFWHNQFRLYKTQGQKLFDIMFGIFLPIICLYFDPILFCGDLSRNRFLFKIRLLVYLFTSIVIITYIGWLLFEGPLKKLKLIIGGIFIVGALFSLILGIFILPISFLGLIAIIGVLGFTPFATSFVYFREWKRIINAPVRVSMNVAIVKSLISGIVTLISPVLIQININKIMDQSIDDMINGVNFIKYPVRNKTLLRLFGNTDLIVFAYRDEKDEIKKEYLAIIYKGITGEEIEDRLLKFS